MAKAKKVIRKTEKEARRELRKSGALKGLSRKEKKRKIAVAGLGKRKQIRQFTTDEKRLRQEQFQKDMDARRAEAKAKGVVPIYDQPKSKGKFQGSPEEVMQKSGSGAPTKRLREGDSVTFDPKTGLYKIKSGDYVSYSRTKPAAYGARVETKKAKHGGVMIVMPIKKSGKKALGGASMKKMSMYKDGGSLKPVPSDAKGLGKLPKKVRNKMGYMKNGGKVKKRTTTVTENTPSRFSKFTDAQKNQLKARSKKLKGEDKKDFDYDVARSKDTKSKTTTTTRRKSGKVKSVSVTEKRKSLNPGKSTDVTTTSKKRRGGSTRVKITSYGAGDDKDAGRVVKQKFSRKGGLKKSKVLKAMYGAEMKK